MLSTYIQTFTREYFIQKQQAEHKHFLQGVIAIIHTVHLWSSFCKIFWGRVFGKKCIVGGSLDEMTEDEHEVIF